MVQQCHASWIQLSQCLAEGTPLSSLYTFQIILELCRNEETANILCVQPHLERIRPPGYTGVSESSVTCWPAP